MRDWATIETNAVLTDVSAVKKVKKLQSVIETVIKGKPEVVKLAIVTLLAKGHLLIEDVPGVGKTTLAHAMALALDCSFQRVQFTSDLLPSDVLGLSLFNQRTGEFEWKPGPIFANIILADEINRTTPKTQSALLEAMAERQVTAEGVSRPLPMPFMVLATQNPLEHHGTYPLPESQLDRFMLRLRIGYPNLTDEKRILRDRERQEPLDFIQAVMSESDILEIQDLVSEVRVDDVLIDYLMQIVSLTREGEHFELGVSPRGSLALFRAAQALALVEGRQFCLPDDIKRLVIPTFAHRVVVNSRYAASLNSTQQTEKALQDVLNRVRVPV